MAFSKAIRNQPIWQLPANLVDWMRIPILPPRVYMTDRADGTVWWLTFNTTVSSVDSLGYISITDTLTTGDKGNYRTFGAYDGPYIGLDPITRLFIRSGYLGYEVVTSGVHNGRSMARKGVERAGREIIIPVAFSLNDPDATLAWDDVEFTE